MLIFRMLWRAASLIWGSGYFERVEYTSGSQMYLMFSRTNLPKQFFLVWFCRVAYWPKKKTSSQALPKCKHTSCQNMFVLLVHAAHTVNNYTSAWNGWVIYWNHLVLYISLEIWHQDLLFACRMWSGVLFHYNHVAHSPVCKADVLSIFEWNTKKKIVLATEISFTTNNFPIHLSIKY